MRYIIILLCLLCLGCSNYTPQKYDDVEVISGFHKGFKGRVVRKHGREYLVLADNNCYFFDPRQLKKIEKK